MPCSSGDEKRIIFSLGEGWRLKGDAGIFEIEGGFECLCLQQQQQNMAASSTLPKILEACRDRCGDGMDKTGMRA
jgi:hypothetical protein